MKTKKWLFWTILMTVAILTGAIAGISYAGDKTANQADAEAMYQNFVSKLATNLSMDEDAVKTALDATKRQMIDEAVQKGTITQEQADRIYANPGCFYRGFGFLNDRRGPGGPKGYGRNLDDIANVLDMTVAELKTEMKSGKKISEIISEHDMTVEQFQEKLLELKKAN